MYYFVKSKISIPAGNNIKKPAVKKPINPDPAAINPVIHAERLKNGSQWKNDSITMEKKFHNDAIQIALRSLV